MSQPIEQKYYPETGELVIVFTIQDIQQALANVDNITITEEKAKELTQKYANDLIESLLFSWPENIQFVLRDKLQESDYILEAGQ